MIVDVQTAMCSQCQAETYHFYNIIKGMVYRCEKCKTINEELYKAMQLQQSASYQLSGALTPFEWKRFTTRVRRLIRDENRQRNHNR